MELSNSIYSQYAKETLREVVYESASGFVSVKFEEQALIISDMFILPEQRRLGKATEFVTFCEQLARKNDKRYVFACAQYKAPETIATLSLGAKLGYQLSHGNSEQIYICKEL